MMDDLGYDGQEGGGHWATAAATHRPLETRRRFLEISSHKESLFSLDDEIMEMIVLIVTDLFLGVSLMRFVVVICYDMSQCSVLSPSPGVRLGANCTSAHLQLSSWGPSGVAAQ